MKTFILITTIFIGLSSLVPVLPVQASDSELTAARAGANRQNFHQNRGRAGNYGRPANYARPGTNYVHPGVGNSASAARGFEAGAASGAYNQNPVIVVPQTTQAPINPAPYPTQK